MLGLVPGLFSIRIISLEHGRFCTIQERKKTALSTTPPKHLLLYSMYCILFLSRTDKKNAQYEGYNQRKVTGRVGNFRQKIIPRKTEQMVLFRRNSGCSAEHKILGIPFRTVPQKMLRFLYHGIKLDANARNSVPKHVSEENMLSTLFGEAGFFVKLIVFMPFPSVPSFGIDSSVNLGMHQNEHFLARIT
jgi:hypothetical protein